MTAKQRGAESLKDFAERMAAKHQYGYNPTRNCVYLHHDDWKRILDSLTRLEEVTR